MPVKNKVNQLISHLSYFLYIISGIVLLSNGRTALAIDYIEITNPKFIPVKVGVSIGAGTEADHICEVTNLPAGDVHMRLSPNPTAKAA